MARGGGEEDCCSRYFEGGGGKLYHEVLQVDQFQGEAQQVLVPQVIHGQQIEVAQPPQPA